MADVAFFFTQTVYLLSLKNYRPWHLLFELHYFLHSSYKTHVEITIT